MNRKERRDILFRPFSERRMYYINSSENIDAPCRNTGMEKEIRDAYREFFNKSTEEEYCILQDVWEDT